MLDDNGGMEVEKFSWMTCVVQVIDRPFVPDWPRLVTSGWIDHSPLELCPTLFVTTKTVAAIHGGNNAANAQIVVTSANRL